jgi:hypothetical protein
MKKKLKYLLKFVVPYNFVLLWWSLSYKKNNWGLVEKDLLKKGYLREIKHTGSMFFDYQKMIDYLVGSGCDLSRIKDGSISEPSLNFCASFIRNLDRGNPIVGLHIGNFVGISLAFFVNLVRELHPESRVVSIDPNIQHRGIKNPLNIVVGLLNKFGLQDNCLILTGYSLEINPYYEDSHKNDHLISSFDAGLSCAQQLRGLEMISSTKFDFCVMDGNHLGDYLKREIEAVDRLLNLGSLLLLDDVNSFWNEVQEIYETIDPTKYQKLGTDGRVGILKKIS